MHIPSIHDIIGNISSRPYFTEAVAALRNNQQACNLLGEPVRIKSLKLGMKENYVDTRQAQVSEELVVGY